MRKVVWALTTGSTGPVHILGKSQTLGFCQELVHLVLYTFFLMSPWFIFTMAITRRFKVGSGSRSGVDGQDEPALTEDHFREIIREEVVSFVRGQIPKLVGSVKAAMME